MTAPTIFMTGFSSPIEHSVARRAIDEGASVRTIVPNVGPALRYSHMNSLCMKSVDSLDIGDLRRAIGDASVVFFTHSRFDVSAEIRASVLAKALKDLKVETIVHLCWMAASQDAHCSVMADSAKARTLLCQAAPKYICLERGFSADILYKYSGGQIAENGRFFLPVADAKLAPIAPSDIYRTAAHTLVNHGQIAAGSYQITGPESNTLDGFADTLSDIYNKNFVYGPIQPDTWRTFLLKTHKASEIVAQHLSCVGEQAASGAFDAPSQDVEQLTGQAAMSLQDYVGTHKPHFGIAPQGSLRMRGSA